jgi:uncharacterized protein YndB with AHSA1/START domain
VFKAWTDPKHVAVWWGPKGFTNPVCELDVRPGGAWSIHMRGPDGAIYPSKGFYREVVAPERLILTDSFDQEPKPVQEMLWTVTFAEHDGETKLTIHVRCQSVADRDTIVRMGWSRGLRKCWNALPTISRTSDAKASPALGVAESVPRCDGLAH